MDEHDNIKDEIADKIALNLKNAVSQLKSDVANAFSSDNTTVSEKTKPSRQHGENTDKTLKLTEYLLQIKERVIEQQNKKLADQNITIKQFIELFSLFATSKPSMDSILLIISRIMRADSAIIWIQNKDEHSVYTAPAGDDSIVKQFISVLPVIADKGSDNTAFSHNGIHYFALSIYDEKVSFAMLVMRKAADTNFDADDIALGDSIGKILFNILYTHKG